MPCSFLLPLLPHHIPNCALHCIHCPLGRALGATAGTPAAAAGATSASSLMAPPSHRVDAPDPSATAVAGLLRSEPLQFTSSLSIRTPLPLLLPPQRAALMALHAGEHLREDTVLPYFICIHPLLPLASTDYATLHHLSCSIPCLRNALLLPPFTATTTTATASYPQLFPLHCPLGRV